VGWTCDGDALRIGLLHIKGIGDAAANAIFTERAKGQFTSVDNFRDRIERKQVNSRALDALIRSGAFDKFGNRSEASNKEIAEWEKELLNINISTSGESSKYADLLKENIYTEDEINELPPGTTVIIGGEVTSVEHKKSKRGSKFANVTIAFEMSEWNVKFWEESLNNYGFLLEEGATLMVRGPTDEWNGFKSITAKEVTDVATLAREMEEKP
jgi:DNA polymerase-3 subunit alpha